MAWPATERLEALRVGIGDAGPDGEGLAQWCVCTPGALLTELEQRQRVARVLAKEPFGFGVVDFAICQLVSPAPEQFRRRLEVEAGEPCNSGRSAPSRSEASPFADGQHHGDRVAGEPARREQQSVRARPVEPVGIVDDREHGESSA